MQNGPPGLYFLQTDCFIRKRAELNDVGIKPDQKEMSFQGGSFFLLPLLGPLLCKQGDWILFANLRQESLGFAKQTDVLGVLLHHKKIANQVLLQNNTANIFGVNKPLLI